MISISFDQLDGGITYLSIRRQPMPDQMVDSLATEVVAKVEGEEP